MENEEEEFLDESWIKEFEKSDKLYEKYYLDNLYNIKLYSVYLDECRNIQNIKEERIVIENVNVLSRDELVGILKKNSFYNDKKFTIHSILKYNIDLEPLEIEDFLKKKTMKTFLTTVNHIQDIPFKKSINMFQDLNELYLFFFEKREVEMKNATKRVYIKKTPLVNNKKSTMRKQYS